MSDEFYVRQGDTADTLTGTCQDADGNAVDIQDATIAFTMRPVAGGSPVIAAAAASNDQTGDGSDGSKGDVSYTWQTDDTDTPGDYLAEWVVTFSGGAVQTYPNGSYILIHITPDAPIATSTRFATSNDLQDWLGVEFTADDHVRAAKLLATATGLIQKTTRQTIALVTDDAYSRPGAYADRVRLPQRPVVSITSVVLDGDTLTADDDWYLDGDELVRAGLWPTSENRFIGHGGGWGDPSQTLVVTYTHGYAAIPDTVKTVCLQMAARVWVNPAMVQQENYGPVQTSYGQARGMTLTPDELAAVQQAVGRTAGSVTVR